MFKSFDGLERFMFFLLIFIFKVKKLLFFVIYFIIDKV